MAIRLRNDLFDYEDKLAVAGTSPGAEEVSRRAGSSILETRGISALGLFS